jgi:hypothetical protein
MSVLENVGTGNPLSGPTAYLHVVVLRTALRSCFGPSFWSTAFSEGRHVDMRQLPAQFMQVGDVRVQEAVRVIKDRI